MSEKIELSWGVDDGYVGNRPHDLSIDMDDLLESCDNIKQAEKYLSESVQEEFQQTISWYCDFSEALAAFTEAKARQVEDGQD